MDLLRGLFEADKIIEKLTHFGFLCLTKRESATHMRNVTQCGANGGNSQGLW